MEKFFLFSLCVIFATASAFAQEPALFPTNDQLVAEMRDTSRPLAQRWQKWKTWAKKYYPSYSMQKDFTPYFEEAEKLLAVEGLKYADIQSSIFELGSCADARKEYVRKERYTRLALSLEDATISLRARHATDMFNILMNHDEFAEAEIMLLKAISTNCTWEITLHPMLAHFYNLTDQPEKCWKVFADCAAANTNHQTVSEIAIAKAKEQYMMLDEEGAKKTLMDTIAALDALKSPFAANCRLQLCNYMPTAVARKIYESVLANTAGLVESANPQAPKILAMAQAEAFTHFIGGQRISPILRSSCSAPEDKAVRDKYFDNIVSNGQAGAINGPLVTARNDAMIFGAYAQVLEFSSMLEKINEKERNSFLFGLYRINALNGLGRYDEAAAFARQRLADFPDYTLAQKFWLAIVAEFQNPNFENAVNGIMKQYPLSDKISAQERSDFLLKAGRSAMIAVKTDVAKAIEKTYNGLYTVRPKLSLVIEFLDKPLSGIADFRARGLDRKMQPIERKFRVDKAFIEADVNITGRCESIGTISDKDFKPAALSVVADELGVHVLYQVPTDDLEAARAKQKDLGSLEIYIAAGKGQPYSCVIGTINDTKFDTANLVYTTAQHKRFPNELSELKRDEIRFEEGAVWKEMFLAWALFSDKLPEGRDIWEFDTIHLSPAGAFSWCGGGKGHSRSTWGELHFNLSKSNILKIKRTAIYSALANYKKERKTTRSCDGIIGHWSDAALGDTNFYNEAVAPLVEKLDSYTKQVSSSMTDADVERIYTEAVPGWNNIVYIINDLRVKYLKNMFSANE